MAERIEYPPEMRGTEEEQIRQIYRYLRKISEQLNRNQEAMDRILARLEQSSTGT